MSYEDLPVGTVLRDPSTAAIYLRVDDDLDPTIEWRQIFIDGSTVPTAVEWMPAWLVELVEKPATPPKLRDQDGELWLPLTPAYLYGQQGGTRGRYTRAEIELNAGPLTEEGES